MKRFVLLCVALVALVLPVCGMIQTLPLSDLVRQAELICIAKVVQVNEIAVDKDQISTVKNVLLSEKLLKGSWQAMEPIVVMTRQSGKYGSIGSLEDQVEFPPKGSRVVLFLKKAKDGSLEPVNLLQGVWPLEDQKPLGMGLGITLQQLEEVVKLNR